MELSLGAQDIRPPARQLGRDTYRHIDRKRRQGHGVTQLRIECAWRCAQQQRKRIHLSIATLDQLENQSLDRRQLCARGRGFKARGDPIALTAFRQAERTFSDYSILFCYLQFCLRSAQLQIGSRHFGRQGHTRRFAVVHCGVQSCLRPFARTPSATP
ncbi:hypothetical protein D3C72_1214390 [compost metagenome]